MRVHGCLSDKDLVANIAYTSSESVAFIFRMLPQSTRVLEGLATVRTGYQRHDAVVRQNRQQSRQSVKIYQQSSRIPRGDREEELRQGQL